VPPVAGERTASVARQERLASDLLTAVLGLSLWVAFGSLVLAVLGDLGAHPGRRVLIGLLLMLTAAAALWRRAAVSAALRARPWLIVVVAAAQLGVIALDGVLGTPYVAVSRTTVALAAIVARPRTVWLCVAVLDAVYAAAVLSLSPPAGLVRDGHLHSVLGALLGFPFVALVLLGLARLFGRLRADAVPASSALRAGARVLRPALTAAIERAGERGRTAARSADSLTNTELMTVAGLARGSTPKGLAHAWGISLETVRTHLKRAKRKTGARTLHQLVAVVVGRDRPAALPAPEPRRAGGRHLPARVVRQPSEVAVARSGAELIASSERFHGGVFIVAVLFVGAAALAALALLPLSSTAPLDQPAPTIVLAGLLVVAAPLVVSRPGPVYWLLRRRQVVELALVVMAAALIVHPLRSELWWPSCALLMLLAVLVPLRRILGYCALVLGANLGAHLVAGDLGEAPAVAIVGLWIGYPAWTVALAVVTDRLSVHLLLLNARSAKQRQPPLHVPAWTDPPTGAAAPAGAAVRPADPDPRAAAGGGAAVTDVLPRLTARQLQVVALLADGLRYHEVGACLSISVRQVERHVAQAIARAGVRTAYELVAVAIAEGLVPARARAEDEPERAITRESAGSHG
jgi:DNA-binding CsgD family transcriptional regulator